jgi:hypothetical protein
MVSGMGAFQSEMGVRGHMFAEMDRQAAFFPKLHTAD